MSAPRVVSLLPAATEIVAAVGCAELLVGRSHECDHPARVTDLPIVTRPRSRMPDGSAAIHAHVQELVTQTMAVYEVDTDMLARLDPDIIITQSLCSVCAIDADVVASAADELLDHPVTLLDLGPARLDDVFADIGRVAAALDVEAAGTQVVDGLRAAMAELRATTSTLPPRTIVSIEWIDPLMGAGNWVPELAAAAGGRELAGRVGEHSPWFTLDELVELDPDVVVVAPCGYELPATEREMDALLARDGFAALRAVRDGRLAVADGHRFFNRPGPRLVDSARILAEIVHPDAVERRSDARAWRWWPTP